MGIQGLLPALKPIQKHKHLSELCGKTLAIDGYGWLHRGAYACATELAQGRPTTKYVDFCMHRVRLLRHYKVEPYVVFDGGPLPAKLGTENERERKREENLKRANELAKEGKHSLAREFFVKCLDVTPQMAYQVIKALRAEGVSYVVAPYEADAQLAYLELSGYVDGILTEDSDLLVFGCQNVLFKLDIVNATAVSISRTDFGSSALASSSMSLIGWNDAQFRWMAMLSGCDYLPSIQGVGLKTAWILLKKHRTVKKVISALRVEGKKAIPSGYFEKFILAEKAFLYQRVYDPRLQVLVNLNQVPEGSGLDTETESYIGKMLEPALAIGIANGDICPISLTSMKDINPSFVPRTTRRPPLKPQNQNVNHPTRTSVIGSVVQKPIRDDIRSFFVSKGDPGCRITTNVGQSEVNVTGRDSGKRTLTEVMEEDIAARKKKKELQSVKNTTIRQSQYFGEVIDLSLDDPNHEATASDDAQCSGSTTADFDSFADAPEVLTLQNPDPVHQEDGYISPSLVLSRACSPEFPSPVKTAQVLEKRDPLDADVLSSPDLYRRRESPRLLPRDDEDGLSDDERPPSPAQILVPASSPSRPKDTTPASVENELRGPDLCDIFNDVSSDIAQWDNEDNAKVIAEDSPGSSGGPLTPEDSMVWGNQESRTDLQFDDEDWEEASHRRLQTLERVAQGWRNKWGFATPKDQGSPCPPSKPKTKPHSTRRETTESSRKQKLSVRRASSGTTLSETTKRTREVEVREVSSDIEEVEESTVRRLGAFRFRG